MSHSILPCMKSRAQMICCSSRKQGGKLKRYTSASTRLTSNRKLTNGRGASLSAILPTSLAAHWWKWYHCITSNCPNFPLSIFFSPAISHEALRRDVEMGQRDNAVVEFPNEPSSSATAWTQRHPANMGGVPEVWRKANVRLTSSQSSEKGGKMNQETTDQSVWPLSQRNRF